MIPGHFPGKHSHIFQPLPSRKKEKKNKQRSFNFYYLLRENFHEIENLLSYSLLWIHKAPDFFFLKKVCTATWKQLGKLITWGCAVNMPKNNWQSLWQKFHRELVCYKAEWQFLTSYLFTVQKCFRAPNRADSIFENEAGRVGATPLFGIGLSPSSNQCSLWSGLYLSANLPQRVAVKTNCLEERGRGRGSCAVANLKARRCFVALNISYQQTLKLK